VYVRRANSFVLVCSLSSHRHSYTSFLWLSLYRFIINNTGCGSRSPASNAFSVETGKVCGRLSSCLARKEIDNNNKRKDNHTERDTSSIQDRVVYTEHCTRKGTLSKPNQVITSTSIPNDDPSNIDLLRPNHPETTHPVRDPVRLLSSRLWPRPPALEEYWSSDAGVEFLDKWFSVPKIWQYFRTHSPVTMPDIDGWHPRDLISPLFFNDNTELHNLVRRSLILPYITGSFHSSFIEEYTSGLLMTLQKPDGDIHPQWGG
jgi:hypothetical protein